MISLFPSSIAVLTCTGIAHRSLSASHYISEYLEQFTNRRRLMTIGRIPRDVSIYHEWIFGAWIHLLSRLPTWWPYEHHGCLGLPRGRLHRSYCSNRYNQSHHIDDYVYTKNTGSPARDSSRATRLNGMWTLIIFTVPPIWTEHVHNRTPSLHHQCNRSNIYWLNCQCRASQQPLFLVPLRIRSAIASPLPPKCRRRRLLENELCEMHVEQPRRCTI